MNERNLRLNYDSPTEIKILLDMMGLGPRKRWGQNFLINPGARERLVKLLDIQEGEKIWEIGPGLGAMTTMILDKGADFTAFEIDPGYCEYLEMAFSERGLKLVQGDIMNCWFSHWNDTGAPAKILGNLPYNVASAIIGDLLEKQCIPEIMVFMVQKEMGDRMTASCGKKDYSSFSILCQYYCDIQSAGVLNPGSFYPAPRVSSTIIVMKPLTRSEPAVNQELFMKLVRGLFLSRRKTLHNNLKRMCGTGFAQGNLKAAEQCFFDNGIDTSRRPETLKVEEFIRVSNLINDLV